MYKTRAIKEVKKLGFVPACAFIGSVNIVCLIPMQQCLLRLQSYGATSLVRSKSSLNCISPN